VVEFGQLKIMVLANKPYLPNSVERERWLGVGETVFEFDERDL
jgi:hypothetical protein